MDENHDNMRRDPRSDCSVTSAVSMGSQEHTTRERFTVLKKAYEQRIAMLSETLEKTCQHILTDDIVVSMTSDPTSSIFVPSLLREIIQSNIHCDRESALERIIEENVTLRKERDSTNVELQAVRDNVKRLQAEKDRISEVATSDQKKYEILEDKAERLSEELTKKNDQLELCSLRLSRNSVDTEEYHQLTSRLHGVSEERDAASRQIRALEADISKLKADAEMTRVQQEKMVEENEKCKRGVRDIMSKVEELLQSEYAQSEAAIESARVKLQEAQEKCEADIKHERENTSKLQEELLSLRSTVAQKTQEYKKQESEVENLRDQVNSYHDKIIYLKRQIEELSVDLVNQRNAVADSQHKYRQAERALGDSEAIHRREKLELEQQVRMEMEKRLESDRRQLEQRSDVYRLHYRNQYDSLRGSREATRQSLLDQIIVDSSQSYEGEASGGAANDSVQRLISERNELIALLRQHELIHGEEMMNMKKKFDMASSNISRLKLMVEESKAECLRHKDALVALQTRDFESSKNRSNQDNSFATSFNSDRERTLLQEIEQLRKKHLACEEQAKQDQEDDTKLLQEMQRKFDTLMANYESSCASRDLELEKQRDHISSQATVISSMQSKVEELEECNRELTLRIEAKEKSLRSLECDVAAKELEISDHNSSANIIGQENMKLRQEKNDLCEQHEHCKERLAAAHIVTAAHEKTIEGLKSDFLALQAKLCERASHATSIRETAAGLMKQLEVLRSGMKKTKADFELQIQEVREDATRNINCISGFVRLVLSRTQLDSINQLRMPENKKSAITESAPSTDSTRDSEPQYYVEMELVKVVMVVLLDLGLLTEPVNNSILLSMSSVFLRSPTTRADDIDVLSTKVHNELVDSLKTFCEEKELLKNQVAVLSDDLRAAKLRQRVDGFASANGKTEYSSIMESSNVSMMNGVAVELSAYDSWPAKVKEYEDQVISLRDQIHDLKMHHKQEIERLRMEWTTKDAMTMRRLQTQRSDSFVRNDELITTLESKLRNEQTRRQHLQTRLLAEESAHKKEMEEMDRRIAELKKRAEKAELERSKLVLESAHSV